jgi:hypothetical protein
MTSGRAAVSLLAVAALALTACGGGSSSKAASTPASTSASSSPATSATSPATSSAGSASAPASGSSSSRSGATVDPSKAAFIKQIDAVCADTDAKVSALPGPSSATDYATLQADITSTETLFNAYISKIEALVAQSPDKAALTTNWVALEKVDFNAARPHLDALVAALKAKNAAAIQAAEGALDNVSDHSEQMGTFLRTYGATDCAKLESDDSSS